MLSFLNEVNVGFRFLLLLEMLRLLKLLLENFGGDLELNKLNLLLFTFFVCGPRYPSWKFCFEFKIKLFFPSPLFSSFLLLSYESPLDMLESSLCIFESILDKHESTLDKFNFSFTPDSQDDSFSENKLIFTIFALLLILLQNNIEEESLLSFSIF